MSFFYKVWMRLCQAGIWLYFSLRIYRAWSKIYQFIYERKYKDVKLPEYKSAKEIAEFTRANCIWTADKFKELFDATSRPEKVQYIATQGDHHVGDCDEFAIYNAICIDDAILRGDMKEYESADIMAVMWIDVLGKPNGHNVALIKMADRPAYTYMDYSTPSVYCIAIDDVALAVVNTYDRGSRLLGYAISDPRTLKLKTIKIS
jgi:hypothetical protein